MLEGGNLLTDAILTLLLVKLVGLELLGSMLSGSSLGSNTDGVGTDGFVGLGVHLLDGISVDSSLDVLRELTVVTLSVIRQFAHVVSNMTTENVLAEDFSIKSLLLLIEAGETLLTMRNVDTTIDGSLEGTEDLSTGGGATKTSIEESLEGTRTFFHVELGVLQVQGSQSTAGTEETSAVGSSPVRQTDLDTKSGELVGVGRGQNHITLDLGVDELADDVSVGDTHNKTVLGGVVLVLVLEDQALASIVVSLTLTATTVLDLETLEVGLVLN